MVIVKLDIKIINHFSIHHSLRIVEPAFSVCYDRICITFQITLVEVRFIKYTQINGAFDIPDYSFYFRLIILTYLDYQAG